MNMPAVMRASPTTMALRRRSAMERRVLMLVRSGGGEEATRAVTAIRPRRHSRPLPPSPRPTHCFAELRNAAKAVGLAIQPIDAPYMTSEELLLLGWLAQAQRVAVPSIDTSRDPALRLAIIRCAALLDAGGLRLSPFTIYAARSSWKGGWDEA